MDNSKITVTTLAKMKKSHTKISALTAYDYPFAQLFDSAGVDMILVGDSLGMAVRGEKNTLKVTVDDIAYHTRAVQRGVKRAFLVADMPFMSFHVSEAETLTNAGRLIAEGAEAVKIEGFYNGLEGVIEKLVSAGIPVMGHIGLTPQSIHQLGGFKVQGKNVEDARHIIEQALALEAAGAFAVVLECVPDDLAQEVTGKLSIPTIGIGAGSGCDGQILVAHDILGLSGDFTPKFVKQYANLKKIVTEAAGAYINEVKEGMFPDDEQSYGSSGRKLKVL